MSRTTSRRAGSKTLFRGVQSCVRGFIERGKNESHQGLLSTGYAISPNNLPPSARGNFVFFLRHSACYESSNPTRTNQGRETERGGEGGKPKSGGAEKE